MWNGYGKSGFNAHQVGGDEDTTVELLQLRHGCESDLLLLAATNERRRPTFSVQPLWQALCTVKHENHHRLHKVKLINANFTINLLQSPMLHTDLFVTVVSCPWKEGLYFDILASPKQVWWWNAKSMFLCIRNIIVSQNYVKAHRIHLDIIQTLQNDRCGWLTINNMYTENKYF